MSLLSPADYVRLCAADSVDEASQTQIEGHIRQTLIDEQLALADEHLPELSVRVGMLFIMAKINGHETPVFVDTGAEMTVMSLSCARRLGVERLIDTRFRGMAVGVGMQPILGRVHVAQMEISGAFLATYFDVMATGPDVMLGLDFMRRHEITIDLHANAFVVRSAGVSTPFLAEGVAGDLMAEVHRYKEEEEDSEGPFTPPLPPLPAVNPFAMLHTGAPLNELIEKLGDPPPSPTDEQGSNSRPLAPIGRYDVDEIVARGYAKEEAEMMLEKAGGKLDVALMRCAWKEIGELEEKMEKLEKVQ